VRLPSSVLVLQSMAPAAVNGAIFNGVCWGLLVPVGYATDTLELVGVSLAVNYLVFLVHALPQQSEKFYDATGTVTYISLIVSAFALFKRDWGVFDRDMVLGAMVLIWSIRLGSFLLARIIRDGKDSRFDALKVNWFLFLGVWSMQALWCYLVALPALVVIKKTKCQPTPSILDIVGWGIWVMGMAFEVVADRQKGAWREDKANKGKFINTGLWAYSRHPNYFGEIIIWVGVCISGASCFIKWDWLALLSPVTTYTLLNYVSGVPLLENKAKETWGDDPAWQWYQKHTPCVFPALRRPPPFSEDKVELTP